MATRQPENLKLRAEGAMDWGSPRNRVAFEATSVEQARGVGDAILKSLPQLPPGTRLDRNGGGDASRPRRKAHEEADRKLNKEASTKDANSGPAMKMKTTAKRFAAKLSSFQELLNAESNPLTMAEILQRLKTSTKGSNFLWDGGSVSNGDGHGTSLVFSFQLILWYQNNALYSDVKTRTATTVSFVQKPKCAYLYQPTVPLTVLVLTPRQSYKPMFEIDPRSFHTFKLAWKQFLDFGVADYRTIVGEKLEQWTLQCKHVIEKPANMVYWLLLMVGSYYGETLVNRGLLDPNGTLPTRVPIIRVDSFVTLQALLFTSEKQVLYAGVDPTPSYLQWLQFIGDQYSDRKDPNNMRRGTVFQRNEFFDLPVVIVFYGRILQKANDSSVGSWVGNPSLVRYYMGKYADDNRCAYQIEMAVRIYSCSCALGRLPSDDGGEATWHTWNGLNVCEIGVPFPCTQATFLIPFTTAKPVALLCPEHGVNSGGKMQGKQADVDQQGSDAHRQSSLSGHHSTRGSQVSVMNSMISSQNSEMGDSECSDDDSGRSVMSSMSTANFSRSTSRMGRNKKPFAPRRDSSERGSACLCTRYLRPVEVDPKAGFMTRRKLPFQTEDFEHEVKHALLALGEYDSMHSFAAILAGALNLAKQIIRLHFSIDVRAYVMMPTKTTWQDGMFPWYRELHRPDTHGRSRYSMLLEMVVHGLVGDGFLGGYHEEALDILRGYVEISPQQEDAATPSEGRRYDKKSPKRTVEQNRNASKDVSKHEASPANKTYKGVLGDFQLWTELYESESLLDHVAHFENFSQWCHSAHLVPFLKRCYRRCGIAGLLVGQRTGCHRLGVNPSYPLVLPMAANFCYGHCYPLHRVLEYFYGGMDIIVCSCDDPLVVEKSRSALGLIPGQERLNNLCFFQVSDQLMCVINESQKASTDAFNARVLQQLEAGLSSGKQKKDQRVSTASLYGPLPGNARSRNSLLGGSNKLKKRQVRKVWSHAAATGVMMPDDPFFWFCKQNYALYTYPANHVSRNSIKDGDGIIFRYADMVSRTGTPEPRADRHGMEDEEEGARGNSFQDDLDDGSVPPSINLCQPTETTSWNRQHWEVEKEFVDDAKTILGDSAWFPGALGQRFTFEVKTANVERYVRLGSVPQAQLLYVEHLWVPINHADRRASPPKQWMGRSTSADHARNGSSSGESASSDDDSVAARARVRHPRVGIARDPRQPLNQVVSVMLPPIMSARS
jgi:hypothetical protein